jgi:hypothetical protein
MLEINEPICGPEFCTQYPVSAAKPVCSKAILVPSRCFKWKHKEKYTVKALARQKERKIV